MRSAVSLLVTADDFGVNAARNSGVIDAVARGIVTHVSMVVNGEASVAAAAFLRTLDDQRCSAGLHINLSEGQPLSPAAALTREGRFIGKAPFLRTHAFRREDEALVAAMEAEVVAQALAFRDLTGLSRFRVDGHHHCHVFPAPMAAVVRAARRLREEHRVHFTSVRIPADAALPNLQAVDVSAIQSESECFGEPFWALVSALAAQCRGEFARAGVPSTQYFIGLDQSGDRCDPQRIVSVLEQLDRLHNMGVAPTANVVVELMTHVGEPWLGDAADDYFHCDFSRCESRTVETARHAALLEMTNGRFLRVPAPRGCDPVAC